jgi:hypothetical protein
MPRISSPRPLDLTKPFVTSSQAYGSQPFDLSQNLVTWYRDIQGDFVPDLSGNGNTARCAGSGSFLPVVTSIDTPEFNYSRFDVRSFSFGGGSSGTEYPHIKTVSSTNAPFASDDHSFTDGTKDLPFSISFWIKPQATSAQQYIISKINSAAAFSGYEWSIEMDGKILRTILNGTGAASKYLQWERGGTIGAGEWSHIVATYNGSEDITGIKMYLNGSVISPSSLSFNAYTGMSKTSTPICVGNKFNSTSFAAVSSEEYDGLIHSVAIWKNRALTAAEINALYKAYINGPGGEARSGFISRSPRLMLRELDDLPGSYSTVRRTGDPTRTGALSSNFNDGTSIVFSQSGNVVFPTMLPKGSSFASQAVDIIGQESDISASLPIRSFQQPNHLHYSPTESVGPFDENRAMPATAFFLSGTDPDILPGFTSPARSKIAIEIDITPASDTMVMRNVSRRNVAESQPISDDNTGFLYYNFNSHIWEQIGSQDPATGGALYYDYAADLLSVPSIPSGTFPMQFLSTTDLSLEAPTFISQLGYPKIGTPIATLGAPFSTKYHATSSQSLRLREFISCPFLLESVSVTFGEVNAQRVNGCVSPSPSAAASLTKSGSIRDIDNYVFFAYRQSRKSVIKDTIADVSGSSRFLIFSGSMTFWNSASLYSGISHGPSFDHDFGLPYTDAYAVGKFTGSISMNLKPATPGPQFVGFSSVPQSDGTGTRFVYGVWPGGNSNENYAGLQPSALALQMHESSDGIQQVSSKFGKIDSRSTRKFGGETAGTSDYSAGISISTSTPQSNVSPYLLFPEDEIIFGLEAGVAPAAYSSNFSHITGSFLRITDKPCKVTLYGSMIKDGVEHLPSLNQDLSSNSIHEIIGAEPVLDQFQIEPRSSYYGSYLDDIVTGSMATLNPDGTTFTVYDQDNSRRVIGRRTST